MALTPEGLVVEVKADISDFNRQINLLQFKIKKILSRASAVSQTLEQDFATMGKEAQIIGESMQDVWEGATRQINGLLKDFAVDAKNSIGGVSDSVNRGAKDWRVYRNEQIELSDVIQTVEASTSAFGDSTVKAFTRATTSTKGLEETIQRIAVVTGSLVAVIKLTVDSFKKLFSTGQNITKKLSSFFEKVINAANALKDADFFTPKQQKQVDSIVNSLEQARNICTDATKEFANLAKSASIASGKLSIDKITSEIVDYIEKVYDATQGVYDKIKKKSKGTSSQVVSDAQQAVQGVTQQVQQLEQGPLLHAFNRIRDVASNAMSSLANTVGQHLSQAFEKNFPKASLYANTLRYNLESIASRAFPRVRQALIKFSIDFRNAFRYTTQAAKGVIRVMGNVGKVIGRVAKTSAQVIKGIATAFSKVRQSIQKSAGKITGVFKKMFSGLRRIMSRLFMYLIRAIIFRAVLTGFQKVSDMIKVLISKNESLVKSIKKIKGNFYAILAPIIEWLIPKLAVLADWFARLLGVIARWVQGIFGKSTIQIKEMGKALADTAKQAERSTYSFDELNQLSKDNNGNAFGISFEGLDDIDTASDLLDRLKNKLKEIFDKITNFVDDKIRKMPELFRTIGQRISEAFHNIDFGSIGRWLAAGLNSINGSILEFFSNIDWDALGKGLNKAIKEFADNFDIETAARSLISAIEGILGFLRGFLTGEYDWGNGLQIIFDSILEVLYQLFQPGSETVERLTDCISALIMHATTSLITGGGLMQSIQKFIEGKNMAEFLLGIFEALLQVILKPLIGLVAGILNGIIDTINTVTGGINAVFGANIGKIDRIDANKLFGDYKEPEPYRSSAGVSHVGGGGGEWYEPQSTSTPNYGESMANSVSDRPINVELNIDGQALARATTKAVNNQTYQAGTYNFATR